MPKNLDKLYLSLLEGASYPNEPICEAQHFLTYQTSYPEMRQGISQKTYIFCIFFHPE
jgi:hypothetical protein